MNDPMLPLPGLSPVSGKRVEVKFDGGLLSSDGGVLALREVDQRLRLADRLAACLVDPRAPDQITHSLADIIRFRLLMIAAGYEDGNDANSLRSGALTRRSAPSVAPELPKASVEVQFAALGPLDHGREIPARAAREMEDSATNVSWTTLMANGSRTPMRSTATPALAAEALTSSSTRAWTWSFLVNREGRASQRQRQSAR